MHLASNADSEPVIDNEAGSPEENEEDNRVESESTNNPVLTDKIVEDSTTAVVNDVSEIVQETENEAAKESTQLLQNEEAAKVEVVEPVHEPLNAEAVINSDVPENAEENESEAVKESTQLLQKEEEEVVSKAEVSEPTNKTSTYAEVVTNPLPVVTSELTFETENQTNDASVQKEDEDNENNGHIAENGALPTTEDKKEEESFFTCFSAFKFW